MTKKPPSNYLIAILLLFVGLAAHRIMSQGGSLDPPPGPPGPVMKTLAEIDPGTPISSVPYTIAESGTYYLAQTLETTSTLFNGITIWADHVTLNLKGFSLVGDGAAGRHGISIEGAHKDIMICNGTITNWGGNGVEGPSAVKCRFEDLRVLDNGGSGIRLSGDNQRVTDCTVGDNGGSGIYLSGDNQRVTDCTVSGNGRSAPGGVYGVYVGGGSIVIHCTVSDNGISASSDVTGIKAGNGCIVSGCTASDNGTSAGGWVMGIRALSGSTVTGNTACNNGDSARGSVFGISGSGGSTVTGNAACNNGHEAEGYVVGIGGGADSTVIGNSAYLNGDSAGGWVSGIWLPGGNLVDQNTAAGNGTEAGSAEQIAYGVYHCVYGTNAPRAPE